MAASLRSPAENAARTAVVGLGILVATYSLFRPLVHYIGLLFAGLMLGLALGSVSAVIARKLHVPHGAALGFVLIGVGGAFVGLAFWIGPLLAEQLVQLGDAVPRGISQARDWLAQSELGRGSLARLDHAQDTVGVGAPSSAGLLSIGRGLVTGVDALAEGLVLVFFGFFLAAAPRQYVDGALLLLPPARRARASEVLEAMARALRLWLLARLALMCFVGLAFGLGLWAIGIPLALPLGILAGLLSFVPFLGPTLAFIPAVAVGLLESPEGALRVTALYLVIQFIEGNMIEPVVESRTVSLRPALMLLGQVAAAVWFGPIGVLIASPLVVIVVVVVQMLYLQDRLGEPIAVIGSKRPVFSPPAPPETPAAAASDPPE